MPNIWEQLFGIVVIAVSMVFGGYLYRRGHGDPSTKSGTKSASAKKRPRKKR